MSRWPPSFSESEVTHKTSPHRNSRWGEESVWKVFGKCLPPMGPKRKLSPRKRKLFGRIWLTKRKESGEEPPSVGGAMLIAPASGAWQWPCDGPAPRCAHWVPGRASTQTPAADTPRRPCATGRACIGDNPREPTR